MTTILVLYYSRHGGTRHLARLIARGIELNGAKAVIRTVPDIVPQLTNSSFQKLVAPTYADPLVTHGDLTQCHGLALGSPVYFGNMAAPLKYFIDSTSKTWLKGTLIDKPAIVFSSGSMLHGGQESTPLSMMLPLLHHGMMILGIPHSETALHNTHTGGTIYGPTHITNDNHRAIDHNEKNIAIAAGKRLAKVAIAMNATENA